MQFYYDHAFSKHQDEATCKPSRDPDQCKTPMTRLVDGNKDKAKVSEQIFLSRPSCHVLVVETTFCQFRVKICAENKNSRRHGRNDLTKFVRQVLEVKIDQRVIQHTSICKSSHIFCLEHHGVTITASVVQNDWISSARREAQLSFLLLLFLLIGTRHEINDNRFFTLQSSRFFIIAKNTTVRRFSFVGSRIGCFCTCANSSSNPAT